MHRVYLTNELMLEMLMIEVRKKLNDKEKQDLFEGMYDNWLRYGYWEDDDFFRPKDIVEYDMEERCVIKEKDYIENEDECIESETINYKLIALW